MRISKQSLGGKALFLSSLLLEVLNLSGITSSSSQAEELKRQSDSISRILYCQNIDIEYANILSIKKRLGIDFKPLTQSDVKRYGLVSSSGVVISSLTMTSPLTRIGFEKNDIIIEINGHSIKGPKDFVRTLYNLTPQQHITFRALDHRTGKIGYVQFFIP